jgi:hypothetical protein
MNPHFYRFDYGSWALRLSTFWEIREAGADAFCVAAFNCVMESNILILYDLLDSLPDEEKIRSFIRTFG